MCIIVISDKKPLRLESFQDFAKLNADGAGIMVAHGGKVHTHVTLEGPEAVYAKYIEMYRDDAPAFLHYRMQTHGAVDLANTHPYLVYTWGDGRELYMMHNGILHTSNNANPTMSDTWHFIHERLQKLCAEYPKWFMNEDLLEWLGDFIGNNRFVFLDSDGDYAIVNAQQWSTHDEHLYSNTYAWSSPKKYVPKKTHVAPAYGHYSGGTYYPPANVSNTKQNDLYAWPDEDYEAGSAWDTSEDAYEYYTQYAKEINYELPAGAMKNWTSKEVLALEYYTDLDTFVDQLMAKEFTAQQCGRMRYLLSKVITTNEEQELCDTLALTTPSATDTTSTAQ